MCSSVNKRSLKKRLLRAATALLVLYLGGCVYFWRQQTQIIFKPTGAIDTNPERLGMPYDAVTIPVGSGEEASEIHGYWVPAGSPGRPTILYLHGNDSTIGKNMERTLRLHRLGFSVLLIDYRGFGKTFATIDPSENRVYEDADVAWSYLMAELGASPQNTFIYGHSLGGAIAIELALRHPEAAGLITESTFTSVSDLARRRYSGALNLLPLDFMIEHRFDSISKIGKLEMPLLVVHGTSDVKIPYSMSEALFSAASAAPKPKALVLIGGGGHANSGTVGLVQYTESVSTFVDSCCKLRAVED